MAARPVPIHRSASEPIAAVWVCEPDRLIIFPWLLRNDCFHKSGNSLKSVDASPQTMSDEYEAPGLDSAWRRFASSVTRWFGVGVFLFGLYTIYSA